MTPFNPSSKNNTDDLENPRSPQDEVHDIMQSLHELLDSMKKNHSIISRMAKHWGELPIWMKITGGLGVFGSVLLVGILTLSTLTIVATCVFASLYTLISLGLDNHHTTINGENEQLKSKMLSLGGLLSLTIQKLNDTRLKLASEIDHLNDVVNNTKIDFEKEVSKLTVDVDQSRKNSELLALTVVSLTSHFTESQESIKLFKDNLERHLNELKEGKATFFHALSQILGLEKELTRLKQELNTSLNHNETLLIKYEGLVTQHEKKLDANNRISCSVGVQTDPYAKQLLNWILDKKNMKKNSSITGSQQPLRPHNTECITLP